METRTSIGRERLLKGMALGFPALLAVALMVPRIIRPQFGLFDDATSISIAQETWSGQWDWRQDLGQYGRFRPVYWLGFSLLYHFAGHSPIWYFVGNLILLGGTTFLLGWVVLRLTRRPFAAGVTGTAFVLGGPVVEAAYTLSKPELLQCFFLVASAAAFLGASGPGSKRMRDGRLLLPSLFILLAALTKETTGLLLGISSFWTAVAFVEGRGRRAEGLQKAGLEAREFLAACAAGIAVYVAAALVFTPSILSGAGPRANFTLQWATISANAKTWLDWIVRDWLYILPLLMAATFLIIRERKWEQLPAMLPCLGWLGAWFVLYLPYRFTPEYYLLPFSLGAAVSAGLLAIPVIDSTHGARGANSALARIGAVATAALFLLTLPNNVSNAGIQLSVDDSNADMLKYVAETAPQGALVLVNIREDIEYLWQIGPMLRTIYHRPDLTVEAYSFARGALRTGKRSVMVVSPFVENVPYPSVRLGIPELASRQWEAKLQQELMGRMSLVREVRRNTHLLAIDAPRLGCLVAPPVPFCQRRHSPFDTRRFSAGWRIYTVVDLGE